MKATAKLKEKLFILDPILKTHLLAHRTYCLEMENQRFIDIQTGMETQSIADFGGLQQKKRKFVQEKVEELSERCRNNIKEGINRVLAVLRERITKEIALDDDKKKSFPIQNSGIGNNKKNDKSVFEKLQFPEGMTYGHRASLRLECSRFLRFAYLVDFLSLKALSNIYLGSVKDMIQRLQKLDSYCDINEVMAMDTDESKTVAAAVRGQDPIFDVKLVLDNSYQITD